MNRVDIAVAAKREEEDIEIAEQDDGEAVLVAERVCQKTLDLGDDGSAYNHGDQDSGALACELTESRN